MEAAAAHGAPTFYFHGQPGSAHELELFGGRLPCGWYVPDRSGVVGRAGLPAHFDRLAGEVRQRAGDGPARLVGFSLGAYVALEVAARLPQLALTIDLVSAAAPLSTGDDLDAMAGKPLFVLAATRPRLFAAAVAAQRLAAHRFPRFLCDRLFASAQGKDKALYRDASFREGMRRIVGEGLGQADTAYRAEVEGYVADWSAVLDRIHHRVTIWHGKRDNWSPPAMAEALALRFRNVAQVHLLEDCSHYSTLAWYLRCVEAMDLT